MKGGVMSKRGRAGGTLVPGPGLGAPNNLHTLTTPSCRDLRSEHPNKIAFKCTFLFPCIRGTKKDFDNATLYPVKVRPIYKMDLTSYRKVSIKLPAVKNGLEARACGLLSLKMHLGLHHVSEGRIQ